LFIIALASTASADTWSDVNFTPSKSNVTYVINETGVTCDSLILGPFCLNVTFPTYTREYCQVSSTPITVIPLFEKPSVSDVNISPIPASEFDTLTATYTLLSNDGYGDCSKFKWFKNNTEIAGQTASTLSPTEFGASDNIILEVTPNDCNGDGDPVNSSSVRISKAPNITNVNLTLVDLLYGNQRYNIAYDVFDKDGDPLSCYVETQSKNVTLVWNLTTGQCFGEINISQNSSNSFKPKVTDGASITTASTEKGIEIEFDKYVKSNKESSLSRQYFLLRYNLTNNIGRNFSNIQWSLNATDTIKTLNLSDGINVNSDTEWSGDFINEDAGYTFSGTQFIAENTYAITRYFAYNNTISRQLPGIELLIPLKSYNDSFLAEKQDGLLWPDITSSNNMTYARFNISTVNASNHTWYRYGYNAFFIDWTGETSSDYRLSGQYKEWTLDRVYKVNFNLTGKTVLDYVLAGNLGEWISKTGTWGSTLTRQSTGTAYTHKTTDNVNSVELSFDPPEDNYTYQLLYYSLVQEGASTGGGGGGGGAPAPLPVTTNQSLPVKFGKVIFAKPLQNFLVTRLPAEFYTEMLIEANGTVAGILEFSDNLAPLCKADVCDIGSDDCQTKVIMDDGETKLLRLYCAADDELAGVILEDQVYEGLLKIRTPQTVSDLPIQLEKAPAYEWTHGIASAFGIPEQMVATGIGILAVIASISFIYFIATKAQGG